MSYILVVLPGVDIRFARTALSRIGPVVEYSNGEYLRVEKVSGKRGGWIGVEEALSAKNDFDPEALSSLSADTESLRFFLVEGRDSGGLFFGQFLADVAQEVGDKGVFLVNYQGEFVPIAEAVRIDRVDPYWPLLSD